MTFIAKVENVSVCLSGDAVDWSFCCWLILEQNGYHVASSENRRFLCCCYPSSFVSECDSVSDMEMKPISPYLTCIPVFLVERHGLFRRGDLRIAGSSLSPRYTLFYHHHSSSQRGLDGIEGRERLAPRQTSPSAQTIVPDLNRQSGHLKVRYC